MYTSKEKQIINLKSLPKTPHAMDNVSLWSYQQKSPFQGGREGGGVKLPILDIAKVILVTIKL